MKAIITVGISASGKTTFANKLVDSGEWVDVNRDWIRFNMVSPGKDWSNYKFDPKKENEVTKIQEMMVSEAFFNDKNVIISDTNLNPKTLEKWKKVLSDLCYDVEVKEFPVSFEEAVKRDNLRPNGVGKDVIYAQWQKWLEYKGRPTYQPSDKQKVVIVDIDGTVAHMNGRNAFDWSRVDEDTADTVVIKTVEGLICSGAASKIVFISGRDSICREKTKSWIDKHFQMDYDLFMRNEGDMRKDFVVKEEMFWEHIQPKYDVVAVFDDRPSVVRLWYELKIPKVFCVGNPWVEF